MTYPDADQLERLCQRYRISTLSLFGSALRDELTIESDVDILVEFERGYTPTLFTMVDLEAELTRLFRRKVDLRTAEDLSRYFREDVVREARPLYEAH